MQKGERGGWIPQGEKSSHIPATLRNLHDFSGSDSEFQVLQQILRPVFGLIQAADHADSMVLPLSRKQRSRRLCAYNCPRLEDIADRNRLIWPCSKWAAESSLAVFVQSVCFPYTATVWLRKYPCSIEVREELQSEQWFHDPLIRHAAFIRLH